MTNKEASNVLRLFANLIEINGLPEERILTFRKAYEQAISELESDTTPQAEWVYSKDKIQFVCSNCGEIPTKYTGCSLALYYLNKYYHFCRNCGAKMKGGAE